MFKNVRGPITENVLTYARGKMPGGFADIAGTTARTQNDLNWRWQKFLSKHVFKKRRVVSENIVMSATIETFWLYPIPRQYLYSP